MTLEQERELYQAALAKWGRESQLDMVIEECAELIDAIQKFRRGRVRAEQIGEELADVQNCINQFIPAYPNFKTMRQFKLERLADLLNATK